MSVTDVENSGTCPNSGCDEPTPFDTAGVVVFGTLYCSPQCALDALDEADSQPDEITVLDPQFAISRDGMAGVSPDDASLVARVSDSVSARDILEDIEGRHAGEFRPSTDG